MRRSRQSFNAVDADTRQQRTAVEQSRKAALPAIVEGDTVVSRYDPAITGVVEKVDGRIVKIKGYPKTVAITSLDKI